MVELADTGDLKSPGRLRPCGFESRPGHRAQWLVIAGRAEHLFCTMAVACRRRQCVPDLTSLRLGGADRWMPLRRRHLGAVQRFLSQTAVHAFVPTPVRYAGAEALGEDNDMFDDKRSRLVGGWHEQLAESAIRSNWERSLAN